MTHKPESIVPYYARNSHDTKQNGRFSRMLTLPSSLMPSELREALQSRCRVCMKQPHADDETHSQFRQCAMCYAANHIVVYCSASCQRSDFRTHNCVNFA